MSNFWYKNILKMRYVRSKHFSQFMTSPFWSLKNFFDPPYKQQKLLDHPPFFAQPSCLLCYRPIQNQIIPIRSYYGWLITQGTPDVHLSWKHFHNRTSCVLRDLLQMHLTLDAPKFQWQASNMLWRRWTCDWFLWNTIFQRMNSRVTTRDTDSGITIS